MQSSDFQNLVQNSSETLRELFLSHVDIDSELPASIGNLTHLTILDLYDCNFTGFLPASVSNLAQLKILNLMGYKFTGSLPSSIGNLTQLRELHLSDTGMIGQIPCSFLNLTQLTSLELSYNEFTGSLPSLESFSNLTYMSLSGNNFDRWKMPDWFGKLKKITHLDLEEANLYGEIPSSFGNLTQLEMLVLSFNQFNGQLPSSLMNLQNLESFFFFNNNITVDLYLFLSLKKLKFLYLSGNNIILSVGIHKNETQPQFKELNLALCNMQTFPEFLRFQHQLMYLYLDGNNIEGLVPGWLWNISKETLGELSLSDNLLMGFERHSPVAPWLNLEMLVLNNNMLTGEIPLAICDLPSLQLLELSFNNITGSIPSCLEKLSNSLVMLNLRSNILQGIIPNIFTKESKLQMIDLSQNQLEGQIPRSLENCESLMILDLGYNFLEDMFPFWLGTLLELQVLILRFNKFHGIITISSKIKVNFPKLHIIDLSYNSFHGDLPHQYFQMWSAMKETIENAQHGYYRYTIQMTSKGVTMEYVGILYLFSAVDLSNNMFRGKIPGCIKTLTGLQLLNLSNNELSGVIPSSMGNLKHLEALDLSSNKLSGMIPQALVQLNFLEFLNVSNNSLIGPIPQGKQFNTFSNDSYIRNHALCGFPLSIECGGSEASKSPKVSSEEDTESDFPNGIDWVVILIGVVSGLVIGLICGNHLTTRYYKWFH